MLKLRDIMTDDPVTVPPEMTLREVAELLSQYGISGVPVVGVDGKVLGVVSASDIIAIAADEPPDWGAEQAEPTEWSDVDESDLDDPDAWSAGVLSEAGLLVRMRETAAAWDRLDAHTAGDVMTRHVEALSGDADLATAARRMLRARVHRLLVTDQDRLIGVVSASDFVRAVADRRLRG